MNRATIALILTWLVVVTPIAGVALHEHQRAEEEHQRAEDLKSHNQLLVDYTEDIEHYLNESEVRMEKQNQTIASLQDRLDSKNETIDDLQEQLSHSDSALSHYKNTTADLRIENNDLRDRIDTMRSNTNDSELEQVVIANCLTEDRSVTLKEFGGFSNIAINDETNTVVYQLGLSDEVPENATMSDFMVESYSVQDGYCDRGDGQ